MIKAATITAVTSRYMKICLATGRTSRSSSLTRRRRRRGTLRCSRLRPASRPGPRSRLASWTTLTIPPCSCPHARPKDAVCALHFKHFAQQVCPRGAQVLSHLAAIPEEEERRHGIHREICHSLAAALVAITDEPCERRLPCALGSHRLCQAHDRRVHVDAPGVVGQAYVDHAQLPGLGPREEGVQVGKIAQLRDHGVSAALAVVQHALPELRRRVGEALVRPQQAPAPVEAQRGQLAHTQRCGHLRAARAGGIQ
mmetsp:Transcript_6691/g.20245  ORF Transcript_6691/g.20245 Transcript_6691/m.20245 type:complete len:255 (-) Transcript_6691:607-1371(-)